MEDDGHEVNGPEDIRKKKDVTKSERETDETWVMVGLSRIQCSHPVEIFGSTIRNSNTIELTIRRAERYRSHGRWNYLSKGRIIRVEMTPVQFAELITSANMGDGVPCSLRELEGKQYGYKYGEDMGDTVKTDMADTLVELKDRCNLAGHHINTILKRPGRVSAAEKDEMAENLHHILMGVNSNLPFVEKQFKKTMNEAVLEAKQEINAHMEMTVRNIGLDALANGERPKTPELMTGAIDVKPEPVVIDTDCHCDGAKNIGDPHIDCPDCNTQVVEEVIDADPSKKDG